MQVGLWRGTECVTPVSVLIQGRVFDFAAQVSIWETFSFTSGGGSSGSSDGSNAPDNELTFKMQFSGDLCVVHGFEVSVDGKLFVGQLEARGEPRYHDLPLEDTFTCRLGNILAHARKLELKVTYITRLVLRNDAWRFTIPETLSNTNRRRGEKHPFDIIVDVDFTMSYSITNMNTLVKNMNVDDGKSHTAHALLKNEHALDAGFIFLRVNNPHEHVCLVERDDSRGYACMVAFTPKLKSKTRASEVVLVVDCAFSQKNAFQALQTALQQAIRCIPIGTPFNVYGASGGPFTKLFATSSEWTDQSHSAVAAFIKKLEASSTQSNVLELLADIYLQPLQAHSTRQILIVNNGNMLDLGSGVNIVQKNSATSRLSFISVIADGGQTNFRLLENVSKAGRGDVMYINSATDKLEEKILQQLERVLWLPTLSDAHVDWGAFRDPQTRTIAHIGNYDEIVAQAFIPMDSPKSAKVFLRSQYLGVSHTSTVAVNLIELEKNASGIISRQVGVLLFHRARQQSRENAARVSLQYGLATPYSAFVVSTKGSNLPPLEGVVSSVVSTAEPTLPIPIPVPGFSSPIPMPISPQKQQYTQKKKRRRVYDTDFMLQFRALCTEPPEGLPPLSILLRNYAEPPHNPPKNWRSVSTSNLNTFISPRNKNNAKALGHRRGSSQSSPRSNKERLSLRSSQGDSQSDYDDIYRKVNSILNKITWEKFASLSAQLASMKIPNVEVLTEVIRLVFDKAVLEPNFSTMYAELCKILSEAYPTFTVNGLPTTFRRILLTRCQKEFDARPAKNAAEELTPEQEETELKERRKMLGNIKFIGELFKLDMLTEKIMHECIARLLGDGTTLPSEEDLEALSKLTRTVGKLLEGKSAQAKITMDGYYARITALSKNNALPARIRFMLQDLMELRQHGWVPRRKDNTPQTIAAVHADAEREERRKEAEREHNRRTPIMMRDDKSPMVGSPQRKPIAQSQGGVDRNKWDNSGSRSPKLVPDTSKGKRPEIEKVSSAVKGRRSSEAAVRVSPVIFGGKARSLLSSSSGSIPPPDLPDPDGAIRPPSPELIIDKKQEKLTPEELDARIDSILEEYYSIEDISEAVECVRELNQPPDSRAHIVARAINFTLERSKTKELDLLDMLFSALTTSTTTSPDISREQFGSGIEKVLEFVEDLDVDIPSASKHVANLIGAAIARGVLSLSFLQGALAHLVKCGKAEAMLAVILQKIDHDVGENKLRDLYTNSTIDLTTMFKPVNAAKGGRYIAQFFQENELPFLGSTSPKNNSSSTSKKVEDEEHSRAVLLSSSETPNTLSSSTSQLNDLLSLQSTDGTWEIEDLAEHFKVEPDIFLYGENEEEEEEKDSSRKGSSSKKSERSPSFYQHNSSSTVWATCLALSHLDHEYKDVKDEWEGMARKARVWLDAQKPPNRTRPVDSLLSIASRFLSEQIE